MRRRVGLAVFGGFLQALVVSTLSVGFLPSASFAADTASRCASEPWHKTAPTSAKDIRNTRRTMDGLSPSERAAILRSNMLESSRSAKESAVQLQAGADANAILQELKLPHYFKRRLVEAAKQTEEPLASFGATPEGTAFGVLVRADASCPSGEIRHFQFGPSSRRELTARLWRLGDALALGAAALARPLPLQRSNIAIDGFLSDNLLTAERFERLTAVRSPTSEQDFETPPHNVTAAMAGQPVFDTQAYSGVAALFSERSNVAFCSGTLVKDDLILTAAHCFCGDKKRAEGVVCDDGAHAGRPEGSLNSPRGLHAYFLGAGIVAITHVQVFKGFDFPVGDIAIARLESKVKSIVPAQLYFEPVPPGTEAHAIGYGMATEWHSEREIANPKTRNIKRYTALKLVRCSDKERGKWAKAADIDCWEYAESGRSKYGSVCEGDSGGPIIAQIGGRNAVIGVVTGQTGGRECLRDHVGVANSLRKSKHCDFMKTLGLESCDRPFDDSGPVDGRYGLLPKDAPEELMLLRGGVFDGTKFVWEIKQRPLMSRRILFSVNTEPQSEFEKSAYFTLGGKIAKSECTKVSSSFIACELVSIPEGADARLELHGGAAYVFQAAATW